MPQELKPGDRVRVTTEAYRLGYLPGEKGTVAFIRGGASALDPTQYAVRMDKAPAGRIVFFNTGEIEPDV